MESKKAETIDQYILQYSGEIKNYLELIRKIIKENAPESTEKISWAMPTFFLKKNLVHFAAHKNHLGFYPSSSALVHFKDRLLPYKTTKGAVQFPYNKELPVELIKDIVIFRVMENKKL